MTTDTKQADRSEGENASGRGATGRESGRPDKRENSRTEGTDRDFDESGEGKNQGHGHPREERTSS